ncbi:MAG: pyridoxamine 5'-phosphate oxidase family protein [Chloroflexi bacterium]|nr:pyridoxamine 5'-phosphate oxidase family protein [Chloroflexota bacterium]
MGVTIGTELSPDAIKLLQGDRTVVLATVDANGWPDTAPFAWAVAKDTRTVRVAVNHQVATLENIRRNGRIRICLVGGGQTISIKGNGSVVKERMASVALPTAMVEIAVEEVKNDAVMGRIDGEKVRWDRRGEVASDSAIVGELLS